MVGAHERAILPRRTDVRPCVSGRQGCAVRLLVGIVVTQVPSRLGAAPDTWPDRRRRGPTARDFEGFAAHQSRWTTSEASTGSPPPRSCDARGAWRRTSPSRAAGASESGGPEACRPARRPPTIGARRWSRSRWGTVPAHRASALRCRPDAGTRTSRPSPASEPSSSARGAPAAEDEAADGEPEAERAERERADRDATSARTRGAASGRSPPVPRRSAARRAAACGRHPRPAGRGRCRRRAQATRSPRFECKPAPAVAARILHLSDLHLGRRESFEPLEALPALVARVEPELLVATGDLAHSGKAATQLERGAGCSSRRVGAPCSPVPGNHDIPYTIPGPVHPHVRALGARVRRDPEPSTRSPGLLVVGLTSVRPLAPAGRRARGLRRSARAVGEAARARPKHALRGRRAPPSSRQRHRGARRRKHPLRQRDRRPPGARRRGSRARRLRARAPGRRAAERREFEALEDGRARSLVLASVPGSGGPAPSAAAKRAASTCTPPTRARSRSRATPGTDSAFAEVAQRRFPRWIEFRARGARSRRAEAAPRGDRGSLACRARPRVGHGGLDASARRRRARHAALHARADHPRASGSTTASASCSTSSSRTRPRSRTTPTTPASCGSRAGSGRRRGRSPPTSPPSSRRRPRRRTRSGSARARPGTSRRSGRRSSGSSS